jgi:hypothetical protein
LVLQAYQKAHWLRWTVWLLLINNLLFFKRDHLLGGLFLFIKPIVKTVYFK